ncbi:hypothetical protein MMC16_004518 [Acarospora aff. strigata]|nr:hypothetical protein [Acarospora aff. strigata]
MSLSASVDIGKLFDGFCSIPTQFSALPAPSFLVVAVIEALRHSHYGTITEVVPGEADTFCAARARSHEGIVLSNDSDLLVADLGSEGSVSLFGDLSLSAESTSESLRTNLFKPREMAAQLGLPDIRGLAFELTQDSTMSLHEAVRRAKSLTQTVDKNALYQDFIKCYEAVDSSQVESTAYARCSTNSLLLDPRVSELVLQYTDLALQTARNMKAEDEILEPKMYLPFLLDDPARSSAWVASSSLRELAYSLLSLSINDDTKPRYIAEYGRRGHRIAATTVSLYEREECKAHSMALTKRLQTARSSFGTLSIPDFSRVYGLYELCRWFRENDKPIPPQDLRKKLMGCEYQDQSLWTWDDIHLSAQLQGILYSLRIVQQITAQVTHDVEISDDWLERLHDQASTLPPVNKLFPSRHHPGNEQLPGSSWDRVIRSMSKLLDDEFTKLEHDILDDLKDGIAARSNLDYASTNTPASRQALVPSKKRRRKERVDGTATERSAPRPVNNLYSVLDRN